MIVCDIFAASTTRLVLTLGFVLSIWNLRVIEAQHKLFRRLYRVDAGVVVIGNSYVTTSYQECSLGCCMSHIECNTFAYEASTGLCTLGSEVNRSGTIFPSAGVMVYSNNPSNASTCDTTHTFLLKQYGGESAYLYKSTSKMNYQNSAAECEANCGRLFAAKTSAGLRMIEGMVTQSEFPVWVGFDDILVEGTYVWSDGTFLTDAQRNELFPPGRPDNYLGVQDCGTHSPYVQGGLDDDSCGNQFYFICELIP